jgi:hypothetical protein
MKVSMSLKEALYIGWLCDGCPTSTKVVGEPKSQNKCAQSKPKGKKKNAKGRSYS